MRVYRIAARKHIRDLSGTGALLYGGRWNEPGTAALYTSSHLSLAALELLCQSPLHSFPAQLYSVEIEIPDKIKGFEIKTSELPQNWKQIPAGATTKKTGTRILKQNMYLFLKAPSAVLPGEFNYIINPQHPKASLLKIINCEPFSFDQRLYQNLV
ncbi:MAG: RES domain-containing protein [Bacteroidetes bacterium]|nr:RES domain-containing protein [Bacteroidota bacterium]